MAATLALVLLDDFGEVLIREGVFLTAFGCHVRHGWEGLLEFSMPHQCQRSQDGYFHKLIEIHNKKNHVRDFKKTTVKKLLKEASVWDGVFVLSLAAG